MTVYTPETMRAEPGEEDTQSQTTMTNAHDDRRPESNRSDSNRAEPTRTMGGVSHTNPVTGQPFGESQVFARGRTVAADGGEAEAADDEDEVARVKDVDHTPREGAPDASAVYERGGEGKGDEPDAEDETGDDDVAEAAEE